MKQKKSKFFTIVFASMFGAGHMYMGFMKQGLSIMGCALTVVAVGSITELGIIYLALFLLWFYSFFDALNKYSLTNEKLNEIEDHSIFFENIKLESLGCYFHKYNIYIGSGFILLGVCMLNRNVLSYIFSPNSIILKIFSSQFLLAIVLIGLGVYLILGHKKSKNNIGEQIKWKESTIVKDDKTEEPTLDQILIEAIKNSDTSIQKDTVKEL